MWSGLGLENILFLRSRRVKMMMAGEIGRKDKGAINVQISLKALVSVVPKTPMGRRELKEDLECIGCTGLLNKL